MTCLHDSCFCNHLMAPNRHVPITAPDDDGFELWGALTRADARLRHELEAELLARHALALTWYEVLDRLDRAPGHQLRMQDLADATSVSRSGLTRVIDRMEADGLVERDSCPDDGRGTFAVVTPHGRRVRRAAAEVHRRGVQRHLVERLGDRDRLRLRDALAKLAS